jgi:hypothetical protein
MLKPLKHGLTHGCQVQNIPKNGETAEFASCNSLNKLRSSVNQDGAQWQIMTSYASEE